MRIELNILYILELVNPERTRRLAQTVRNTLIRRKAGKVVLRAKNWSEVFLLDTNIEKVVSRATRKKSL